MIIIVNNKFKKIKKIVKITQKGGFGVNMALSLVLEIGSYCFNTKVSLAYLIENDYV
jgi:hypothetical protein